MYYDHHSQTFGRVYSVAAFTVVKSAISLEYHGWRPTEPKMDACPWETLGVFTLQRHAFPIAYFLKDPDLTVVCSYVVCSLYFF